jgi:hypothetical protein
LEPLSDHLADSATDSTLATAGIQPEQPNYNEEISGEFPDPPRGWLDDAGLEIIRATRSWIQYGAVGFAVICIVIGAVEALFGR